MKHKPMIAIVCTVLLAMIGCKEATSVDVGPFDVDSNTGIGTGQAFGIQFKAAGASKVEVISGTLNDSDSSKRANIALADDLKIELQTMGDGDSVTFQLNRRDFGTLKKGDEVAIGEDRSVTVNGEKRSAAEEATE